MERDLIVCEKDFWVYQSEQSMFPWALKMTKRYERGKRRTFFVEFDFTLFCETIGNPLHSKTECNVHYDSVSGYVEFLSNMIRWECGKRPCDEDRRKLDSAVLDALMD